MGQQGRNVPLYEQVASFAFGICPRFKGLCAEQGAIVDIGCIQLAQLHSDEGGGLNGLSEMRGREVTGFGGGEGLPGAAHGISV